MQVTTTSASILYLCWCVCTARQFHHYKTPAGGRDDPCSPSQFDWWQKKGAGGNNGTEQAITVSRHQHETTDWQIKFNATLIINNSTIIIRLNPWIGRPADS